MRSSARNFVVACVIGLALASVPRLQAQSSSPKALYTEAIAREHTLRRDIEKAGATSSASAVLGRVRTLVGAYQRMARQFPASGYMDNALWQGALLAADAFWSFGEAADRTTALDMFSALRSQFPTSSLIKESAPHVKRLTQAKSPPRRAIPAAATPAVASAAVTTSTLTGIKRDVLHDAVRITVELAREVPFRVEQLANPRRVFVDFESTRATEALKDVTIPFSDEVVRQVRVGRHADTRTRVVMDLEGSGRYSAYPLYNPYRVVIDFERSTQGPNVVAAVSLKESPLVLHTRDERVAALADAVPATVEERAPGSDEVAPDLVVTVAPPAPPAINMAGGFSLSRQLGLGVSRVVIDPGHGGHDPGAKTSGLTEADLVLDVALRLEQLLKHEGIDVVLTRRVDAFVPLEERTTVANKAGADLFLSIHANASRNTAARGVETYFLNLTTNPEAEAVAARENAASERTMRQLPEIVRSIALNNKIDESRDFASMIQRSLSTQLRKWDRDVRNLGVKQAPFMVLLGATMPSVLAEISFITNREDADSLKTDKHRQHIAEALAAGVMNYQQSLKRVPLVAAEQ